MRRRMPDNRAEHWNEVARGWSLKGYSNELLAEHKRNTYLGLIARWADVTSSQKILKTDLFAEAFTQEQFLFEMPQTNSNVVAIDISGEIVAAAKNQASQHKVDASEYLCCDVRHLPIQSNSIDLIISDSSLDHFPSEEDITIALQELARVLRIGGVLILTIDNKSNLTYPPYIFTRLWMRLRLSPYFIGKTLSFTRLRNVLEEIGLNVAESTAILHYPHPDGLVRWIENFLRKVSKGKLDNAIRKTLAYLEQLERRKIKFLTGRYLAVKAVKVKQT